MKFPSGLVVSRPRTASYMFRMWTLFESLVSRWTLLLQNTYSLRTSRLSHPAYFPPWIYKNQKQKLLNRRARPHNSIFSLHASGDYVPIIRRNNCVYAILGTCHSVWVTVWYAGWNLHTRQSSTHTVTNTKCRIDTVISPDDGHTVARNM
jgi:hypothetical protein